MVLDLSIKKAGVVGEGRREGEGQLLDKGTGGTSGSQEEKETQGKRERPFLPCFGEKRTLQSCKASVQLGPAASTAGR